MLELEPPFYARVHCRPLPETPLLTPAKGVGTLAAPVRGSGNTMLDLEPPFHAPVRFCPLPESTTASLYPITLLPLPYPRPPPPIQLGC